MNILAYKSPKTPFYTQKYLTRYTQEMFFEEYINFKIVHYLKGQSNEIFYLRFFTDVILSSPLLGF